MAEYTHWKKLNNPSYLGAYSVEPGKDIVLTINTVRQEQVIGADGKKEECIVCRWVENEKPMILNATNCKTISKLLKTPYIEAWKGSKIQIGVEKVKAFGDVVEALRIRPFLPKMAAVKCEACGSNIVGTDTLSPEQLGQYTLKKYGKKLCAACATKAASEKKEGETG